MLLRTRILSAACIAIGLGIGSQRTMADIYTYALQTQTGVNAGGSLGGTITVVGTAGNSFPALNDPSVTGFSLTYTPTSGPALNWTQAGTISVNYNAAADFTGKLGDASIFALPPSSGSNFWTVTNPDTSELNIFWTASPLGPNWLVRSQSQLVDYNYGAITLSLQSDVVPEPASLAFFGAPVIGMLVRRRRAGM